MAKEDYGYKQENKQEKDTQDMLCASIIMSTLIRGGATKSAAPREAVLLLKELKKQYSLENLGS